MQAEKGAVACVRDPAQEGLKVGSHCYALGNLAAVSSGEHALAELLTEVSADLVHTVDLVGEVGVY